jgi:RNA polymerase sigma-70 factor (ECF subfamily)
VAAVSRPEDVSSSPQADAPPEFDEIYRQYGGKVARWAARVGGPLVAVEDVVQEVFIVVSRRLPQFRGEAKLGTWLFSITDRTVRNFRRRERWRRWVSRLTTRIEETVRADQPTPVEDTERAQATEKLYRILDAMPHRHRSLLVLFEIEGMSAAEIGELLAMRPATVRVRLHRARADFRQRLRALDDEDGEEAR